MMQTIRAAVAYFAIVFGAGFFLGSIRLFLLVPRVGVRTAELLEMPVMLIVVIAASRFLVRRLRVPARAPIRLGMGGIALLFMLAAEFGLVLWLRGLSIREYLETRDPVSGTAYYALLCVFALMPQLQGLIQGRK